MAMTIAIIVLVIFAAAEFAYAIWEVWRDEQEAKRGKEEKKEQGK